MVKKINFFVGKSKNVCETSEMFISFYDARSFPIITILDNHELFYDDKKQYFFI